MKYNPESPKLTEMVHCRGQIRPGISQIAHQPCDQMPRLLLLRGHSICIHVSCSHGAAGFNMLLFLLLCHRLGASQTAESKLLILWVPVHGEHWKAFGIPSLPDVSQTHSHLLCLAAHLFPEVSSWHAHFLPFFAIQIIPILFFPLMLTRNLVYMMAGSGKILRWQWYNLEEFFKFLKWLAMLISFLRPTHLNFSSITARGGDSIFVANSHLINVS